jgi:hypothetical protein
MERNVECPNLPLWVFAVIGAASAVLALSVTFAGFGFVLYLLEGKRRGPPSWSNRRED